MTAQPFATDAVTAAEVEAETIAATWAADIVDGT